MNKTLLFSLGLVSSVIFSAVVTPEVRSNEVEPYPGNFNQNVNNNDGFQSNEVDSMSGSFGNNFNPFDLIHNVNLRNGVTGEMFWRRSQEKLNDAAQEFKNGNQTQWWNSENNVQVNFDGFKAAPSNNSAP